MAFPQIGLEAVFKDAGFNAAIKAYKNSINEASAMTDAAGKSMGSAFTGIIGGIGKVLAGTAVLAVGLAAGVSAMLLSTVKGASTLTETLSKTSIVFGDQADAVIAFGEKAATSLGMSENAALTAAATYGNLFRSMGMTNEKSADMSIKLVQLAGDLSSFNNIPIEEVFEKLRAGLSGESEPLKALGININETTIKAQAMSMGLISVGQELTATAKAQAAYALIMQQTALAQGDFARTSEGLANQQRILAAEWQNIKDTIGLGILPIATAFTTAMGSILEGLMPVFENISTQIKTWTLTAASNMFYWGANMVQSLADGMAGSSAVINALNQIGDYFTYMLQANSPPKLLPDLTLWGSAAMNAYLEGWTDTGEGAGKILDTWGKSLQPFLEEIDLGGVFTGDMGKSLKDQFG